MKLPYSIPMETIWHGAKSLAYRSVGAECFGSSKGSNKECLNKQNCSSLCMDLRKSNAPKHSGFSQNHVTKAFSFALHVILNSCRYFCSTVNRYMQYIIMFLNISNREIKRRFRSIDIVVGHFARCQRKNYWCMHAPLDFLLLQEDVHGLGFHSHHAMLQPPV